MKLIFTRDYSPRRKGEIAEFKSRSELRTAEWYIANGIAVKHDCKCDEKKGTRCNECNEPAVEAAPQKQAEVVFEAAPKKAPAKKAPAKK